MWYHPAALILDKRDVIGAWIICLAVALPLFGYPAVTAIPDVLAAGVWRRENKGVRFDPLVDLFELMSVR
jgi:hypothetical protein